MSVMDQLRQQARALKRDTLALYLACRDPRAPWYAKILAGGVVAYALSPIDLIPDFIPVVGYLDDLIIVPLGLALSIKLIPVEVIVECRAEAQLMSDRPTSRAAAFAIVGVWIVVAAVLLFWLLEALEMV